MEGRPSNPLQYRAAPKGETRHPAWFSASKFIVGAFCGFAAALCAIISALTTIEEHSPATIHHHQTFFATVFVLGLLTIVGSIFTGRFGKWGYSGLLAGASFAMIVIGFSGWMLNGFSG